METRTALNTAPAPPLELRLPWPPSVNHYWRHAIIAGRARPVMSAKGRAYREHVAQCVLLQTRGRHQAFVLPVRFSLYAQPPDRRTRDLSNLLKAVEDALTACGVWADDALVDDLRVVRGPVCKGGALLAKISTI